MIDSTDFNSYKIKVPIYVSEVIKSERDLFGTISYPLMVGNVKSKIDAHSQSGITLSQSRRNKTRKREIDKISYSEHLIADVPSLLVQVSAYNTNLRDGFIQMEEKKPIRITDKIGSDTNYFLLYPIITGIDDSKFNCHWVILVYEDPEKENFEIVSIVKLILRKLLNIKVANIKLPEILEELKRIGTISELQLMFTSIDYGENEVDIRFQKYLTNSRIKKKVEEKFEQIPYNTVEEIIGESLDDDSEKVEIKVLIGKNRVYNITKEVIREAKQSIRNAAEEIFNESIDITEADFNEIYKTEFIMEQLTAVLTRYMSRNP